MICWLSGTGNSQSVAARLGGLLRQETAEIRRESAPPDAASLVVVTPLYFWGLPAIVKDFLRKRSWTARASLSLVFTCGGSIGSAERYVRRLLCPARVRVWRLVMPTNYVVLHQTPPEAERLALLRAADQALPAIAEEIAGERGGYLSPASQILRGLLIRPLYALARRTRPFRVSDRCVSCGRCARDCPDQAIRLSGGRPSWQQRRCQHCLRCLHRCLVGAIDYGPFTRGKPRYPGPVDHGGKETPDVPVR